MDVLGTNIAVLNAALKQQELQVKTGAIVQPVHEIYAKFHNLIETAKHIGSIENPTVTQEGKKLVQK